MRDHLIKTLYYIFLKKIQEITLFVLQVLKGDASCIYNFQKFTEMQV